MKVSASISAVIPVYNQCHLTERCLQSLLDHSTLLREVWVIDNASRDQTSSILSGFEKKFSQKGLPLHFITNPENTGFGRACNQGIRKFLSGGASHLAILNNDTWLMQDWDQALVSEMERNSLDCIGPYYFEKPFHEKMDEVAASFTMKNKGRLRHHFVPILMFYRRAAVEALSRDCPGTNGGIFDERFFVTYEDADLLKRMELLNQRYGQSGSCFIWHHSQGTRSQSTLPSNYEQEGHRLFMEKWNFDPRPHRKSLWNRIRMRYWKFLEKNGRF